MFFSTQALRSSATKDMEACLIQLKKCDKLLSELVETRGDAFDIFYALIYHATMTSIMTTYCLDNTDEMG
jgi:hypothetical protein